MLEHIGLVYSVEKLIFFDSFGVEHVAQDLEKFIAHKNIKANIFRIQLNKSIMCGNFCKW